MAFSDPRLENFLNGKSNSSSNQISGSTYTFSDPALEKRLLNLPTQSQPTLRARQQQQQQQQVANNQPIIAKPKLNIGKEAVKLAANTGIQFVKGISQTSEFFGSFLGKNVLDTIVKSNPVSQIASIAAPTKYKKLNDEWKGFIKTLQSKQPDAYVTKAMTKLEQSDFLQPSERWQQADLKDKFSKDLIVETILQVSPSLISSILMGITTGGSGVFITTAGSTAQDVKTSAINSGVSEDKAESLALATGLVVGWLDRALPDSLFGEKAVKETFVKSFTKRMASSIVLESSTEVVQELVQIAAEKTFRDDLGLDEVATRTAMSAFGGFLGGAGTNVVASFFNGARTEIINNDQTALDYLKESSGEMTLTPQQTISAIIGSGIEDTKEGKEAIKTAMEAQNEEKQVKLSIKEDKIKTEIVDEQKPEIQDVNQEKKNIVTEDLKAKKVEDSKQELINIYKDNQQQVEEALNQVWTDLDAAQAGSRIMNDGKVEGIKSTFPSWVPEELRSRKLFDKTLANLATVLDNPEYPATPRLKDLYDVVLDQVDFLAEIDTRDIRNQLLEGSNEKTKPTAKEATPAEANSSTTGDEGAGTEPATTEEKPKVEQKKDYKSAKEALDDPEYIKKLQDAKKNKKQTEPTTTAKVSDLKPADQARFDQLTNEDVSLADKDKPIHVVKTDNENLVVDGHHRLKQAIESEKETIETIVISKEEALKRYGDEIPELKEKLEAKPVDKNDIITTKEQTNESPTTNQGFRTQDLGGQSSQAISDGGKRQGVGGETDTERSGQVARGRRGDGDKRAGDRPGTQLNQVEKNKQIESLVKEKGNNPAKYSEEDKALLREYTGAGGLENQGAEGRGLLDEYYTPKEIVNAVWDRLGKLSYAPDTTFATIVEPSIGIGSFIDPSPDGAVKLGYEINPTSATIASILHENTRVTNKPFEDLFISDRGVKHVVEPFANLVVGNPPYGMHRGKYLGLGEEPKITNYAEYFVKRGLDILQDGGVLAYVMPSGWLNSSSSYGKSEIAKMGELVEAYRLPQGAFSTTGIGTDIVIFKKGGTTSLDTLTNGIYFTDNPDHVLGTLTQGTGQWGADEVKGTLEDAMKRMKQLEGKTKPEVKTKDPINVKENIKAIEEEVVQEAEEANKTDEPPTENKSISKKVTQDIKNKALIVSKKKGPTMQVSSVSNYDANIWTNVNATGELNEKYTAKLDPKTFYDANVSLSFEDGIPMYYPDVTYVAGNVYEKLEQLENNKEKMSAKQVARQEKMLKDALPERMKIQDIKLTPVSRYVKEINLTTESGETKPLISMFSNYLRSLPYQAFGSSSSWEIMGYIQGSIVNSGDKERNIEIKKRRRDLGISMFNRFLREELNPAQKEAIENAYNRNFNSYNRPDYTKVPLISKVFTTFNPKNKPGTYKLDIKAIQKEGAAFLASKGVGALGYDVGVGKTLTAIVAINEVMQRGWVKKPLVIVPNSTYQNWINEISELIPGVKINSLKNLGGNFKGDLKTLQIADGTLSVMTYEGLNKLGFKDETYSSLGEGLKDVMSGFNTTKRAEVKEGAKADEMTGKAAKGTTTDAFFEDLGFDHITIDEAHNFKNIFSGAKVEERGSNEYRNIRGTSSMRGIKAYFAAQYILRENKNRNVFLLSATPFTNNPMEIYSVMSLMAKGRMERMGITNVNDFMSLFVDLKSTFVIKANGTVQEADVVERFNNLQQLQKIVTEYIDFRTGEEAGVERPDRVKKPIFLSTTKQQQEYMKLAEKMFDNKEQGVLPAITEMQKITLSPYLSQFNQAKPTAKEFVDNSPKIKYTMEMISQVKKDNPKVGQVIYMARGKEYLPLMKEYLVKNLGYKASEVGIIAGGMSINKKDGLMNDFNTGKLKVVLGTETIKEGVNLQDRATELYFLHLPWNPTDMLQVEGRIWRQGNKYNKVRIHYPLLSNSVDSFIFQKLETKEKRIANLWSYKGTSIDVSDINFEESKLDLITDPRKRLQAEQLFETSKQRAAVATVKSDIAFTKRQVDKYKTLNEDIKYIKEILVDPNITEERKEYQQTKLKKANAELSQLNRVLKAQNITVEQLSQKQKDLETKLVDTEKKMQSLDQAYKDRASKITDADVESANVKENDYSRLRKQNALENKTFWDKKPAIKNSGKSAANTDTFAKTKKSNQAVNIEKSKKAVSIPFPEMVSLANELMGKYPVVKTKPGRRGGKQVRGMFVGTGDGEIKLNADLFKDVDQAAKTLAHEIGHLADYIPDKTLKRGNLLGRIGSMHKFMRGMFTNPETESKLDILIEKKKGLTDTRRSTSDKAVRKSLLGEIKAANKEIKALQKNSIKNKEVFNELWELSKQWRPLQQEEVMINAATGLPEVVNIEITEDQAPEDYLVYRKSAKELYADALSVLLNEPATLKAKAPIFYNKFIEQIDRKPILKDNLFATWDLLSEPQDVILEKRLNKAYKGYEEAKQKRSDILNEEKPKRSMIERLMQSHVTIFDPIYRKMGQKFKNNGITTSPKTKLRMELEEMQMRRNESYLYINDITTEISKPLEAIGLSEGDLGMLLQLERGLGDRKDIANPYGLQGDFSKETLEYLGTYLEKKRGISAEQFQVLQQVAKKFREFTFSKVEEAAKVGVYSQKFFNETAKPNKDTYATYQVIEYIHDNYVSAGIKHAVGTVKPIENPVVSTLLKTMAVIEQIELQKGKIAVIEQLRANFPSDISDAKAIRPQGVRVGWRPEKNMAHLEYYKDGVKAAVNVDPYIAKMFEHYTPTEMHTAVQVSSSFNRLFKPIVTTYNLSWGFYSNIVRDTSRTYKNLGAILPQVGNKKGMSIAEYVYRWIQSVPEGKNFQKHNITPLLKEMLKNKAFSTPFTSYDATANEAEWLKPILKKYVSIGDDVKQTSFKKRLLRPITKILEGIEYVGSVFETTSKVAGYQVIKSRVESGKEAGYIVRNYAGTPNFMDGGTWKQTDNNIFVFSNIMIQALRSDVELATNPTTRSGYWYKTFQVDILLKMLMLAGASGLFGELIKEIYSKATEYDKTNYIVLPLGIRSNGKANYIRIPQDETGRLFSSIVWKLGSAMTGNLVKPGQVASIGAGFIPSVTPLWSIIGGWLNFAQGRNPYDDYRGRLVIDDTTWTAGGLPRITKMVKWTIGETGLWQFNTYDDQTETSFDAAIKNIPVINRALKSTDYGLTEKEKEAKAVIDKESAQRILREREYLQKAIDQTRKNPDQKYEVGKQLIKDVIGDNVESSTDKTKRANLIKKYEIGLVKGTVSRELDSLIEADTNAYKLQLLTTYKKTLPAAKYLELKKVAVDNKIISDELRKEYLKKGL